MVGPERDGCRPSVGPTSASSGASTVQIAACQGTDWELSGQEGLCRLPGAGIAVRPQAHPDLVTAGLGQV